MAQLVNSWFGLVGHLSTSWAFSGRFPTQHPFLDPSAAGVVQIEDMDLDILRQEDSVWSRCTTSIDVRIINDDSITLW